MFGVLPLTLTHFLAKTIFSRGYGGVHKTYGNSGEVGVGGGGLIFAFKKKKLGEEGDLHEIPTMVGVWIFSGTTHYLEKCFTPIFRALYGDTMSVAL